MRRPRRKGLLAMAGVLAAVLAAEGLLRAYLWARGWTPNCYAAQLDLFRPDAELGYDLRPGFRLRSGVYRISVNALGLRGPDVDLASAAGPRVAILGGSAAFGYLVSDGEEAARILETKLRQGGFENALVLNAGAPGYNLYQIAPRFRRVVAPLRPAVVVLYLGWNDLVYATSDEPDAKRFRARPVAADGQRMFGRSTLYSFLFHRMLGGAARLAPAEFDRAAPTPEGTAAFRRNLEALADAIEAAGATMIVCAEATAANPRAQGPLRESLGATEERIDEMIELGTWLREELRAFAQRRGARFVDAGARIPPTSEYLADYVHLTRAGEERLAEVWFEPVVQSLESSTGDQPPDSPE